MSFGVKTVCPAFCFLFRVANSFPFFMIFGRPSGSLGFTVTRISGYCQLPCMTLFRSVTCLLISLNKSFRSFLDSLLNLESINLLKITILADICAFPMRTRKSCSSITHKWCIALSSASSKYVDSTATHPIARNCFAFSIASETILSFLGGMEWLACYEWSAHAN